MIPKDLISAEDDKFKNAIEKRQGYGNKGNYLNTLCEEACKQSTSGNYKNKEDALLFCSVKLETSSESD